MLLRVSQSAVYSWRISLVDIRRQLAVSFKSISVLGLWVEHMGGYSLGLFILGCFFFVVCLFIICQHRTLCQRCIGNVRWYVQQAAGCKDLWIGRKQKLVLENSLGLFSVQVYSCFMFSCRDVVYNPVAWPLSVIQSPFPSCNLASVSGSLCLLFHHATSEPLNHIGQQGLEFCGLLISEKHGIGRWAEGWHSGWCHETYREKMAFPGAVWW